MKIEHLEERIKDYKQSIKTVVDKRNHWKDHLIPLINKTLDSIVTTYMIGWSVQNLKWLQSNEAINLVFETFPPGLIDCTNLFPVFQFAAGGALVFSQSYNGDVAIFVLYPDNPQFSSEEKVIELGSYLPKDVTEKLIIEKVDEFLIEIIKWEVPSIKTKLGY